MPDQEKNNNGGNSSGGDYIKAFHILTCRIYGRIVTGLGAVTLAYVIYRLSQHSISEVSETVLFSWLSAEAALIFSMACVMAGIRSRIGLEKKLNMILENQLKVKVNTINGNAKNDES